MSSYLSVVNCKFVASSVGDPCLLLCGCPNRCSKVSLPARTFSRTPNARCFSIGSEDRRGLWRESHTRSCASRLERLPMESSFSSRSTGRSQSQPHQHRGSKQEVRVKTTGISVGGTRRLIAAFEPQRNRKMLCSTAADFQPGLRLAFTRNKSVLEGYRLTLPPPRSLPPSKDPAAPMRMVRQLLHRVSTIHEPITSRLGTSNASSSRNSEGGSGVSASYAALFKASASTIGTARSRAACTSSVASGVAATAFAAGDYFRSTATSASTARIATATTSPGVASRLCANSVTPSTRAGVGEQSTKLLRNPCCPASDCAQFIEVHDRVDGKPELALSVEQWVPRWPNAREWRQHPVLLKSTLALMGCLMVVLLALCYLAERRRMSSPRFETELQDGSILIVEHLNGSYGTVAQHASEY